MWRLVRGDMALQTVNQYKKQPHLPQQLCVTRTAASDLACVWGEACLADE